MRKVLVTLARPLFEPCTLAGFAEALAVRLRGLEGVDAEVMTIPASRGGEERLLDDAVLYGMLRTLNVDRVIALNFPAYLAPFADKVVWLSEGAHPLANAPLPAADERAAEVRRMLKAADVEALSRSERLFCASDRLRLAMRDWCGAVGDVLPDPSNDERTWTRTLRALLA